MRRVKIVLGLWGLLLLIAACGPAATTNKPPVAAGQSMSTKVNTAIEITLAATDTEKDPLTFAIVAQPQNGTLAAVQGNKVTYTPSADFEGEDSFTFKANDGKLDSNVAKVTILVTDANTAPTAVSESFEVSATGELPISLKATDADGDTLEFVALDRTGTKGTVQEPANFRTTGQVTYIPAASATGGDTDSFTFTVTDGKAIATGTISITITASEGFVTISNTLLEAGGVAASGNAAVKNSRKLGSSATAEDKDTAEGGKVSIKADGSFSYAPKKDFVGTDSFSYTADGSSQTATITVKDANPDMPGEQHAYYVRPGATGGDGTAEKPFGTLFAAEFFSREGDVIVLHEGSHAPAAPLSYAIRLKDDQKLLGQNVAVLINGSTVLPVGATETVLSRPGEATLQLANVDTSDQKNPVVTRISNNVTIKGLTIDRSNGAGVTADPGKGTGASGIFLSDKNTGTIRIEDVKINLPGGFGIVVAETDRCFSAANCDAAFSNPSDPPGEVGTARARYSIVIKNVTITAPGNSAIALNDPISAAIEALEVIDAPAETIAVGIESEHPASVTVTRSIVRSSNVGVRGFDFHSNNTFDRTDEDALMTVLLDGNQVIFTRTDANDLFPEPAGDGNVDRTIAFRARALDNRVTPPALVTLAPSAGSSSVQMSGKFNNIAEAADSRLACEASGDPLPLVICESNIFPVF